MQTSEELLAALRALEIPEDDHAVFGSGPLLVRGIIDTAGDLDVLCRGAAWDRACELGEMVDLEEGVQIASIYDGAITFGRSWAYGVFDIDELIDTAEIIDGVPFVLMEHVMAYKRAADRPKDRAHLDRIADHERRDST